jgi:hypothetical protein
MLLIAPSGVDALAGSRLRVAADPAKASTPTMPRSNWIVFWAGFLISLSANIDLTLAIFIAAFGLWILFTRWRGLLPYILGAVIPFAISAAQLAAGTMCRCTLIRKR